MPSDNATRNISQLTRKTLEWTFVDGGKSFKHVPAGGLSVDNGEAVVNAAICHSGIIHCHEYMIKRELANGSLVQVLGNFVPRPEPIAAMYPRNRHLTPRVRFFVDFLLDYLDCPTMAT
ncbi:LysR substrate-binding domain-containing protein [Ottowia sp.]|uniref:LysR substrate-binding domain-containing protein n=1 Tax=Ottowia sp. TaxID=1898956 RepID=UPI003C7464B2